MIQTADGWYVFFYQEEYIVRGFMAEKAKGRHARARARVRYAKGKWRIE